MYTLYKFHFLIGISEINQLFDDIGSPWSLEKIMCLKYFRLHLKRRS